MRNHDRLEIAEIVEIVDLARYPIGEPSLVGSGVVERCRAGLDEHGFDAAP